MTMLTAPLAVVGIALASASPAQAANIYFKPGFRFNADDHYQSDRGYLIMQGDGNLVLYCTTPAGKYLWDTATDGNPGAYAVFQEDGNLVVYTKEDIPIWDSGTWGRGATFARISNNGNFAIYRDINHPLWSTGTADRC
ncbi:hypothetical protein [Streptomyces longwoodensis]|uniref:hypothetical protein n=1 Tax=Streptomyces longwoodensis TaxID=68231 RepID=UPI0037FF10BE